MASASAVDLSQAQARAQDANGGGGDGGDDGNDSADIAFAHGVRAFAGQCVGFMMASVERAAASRFSTDASGGTEAGGPEIAETLLGNRPHPGVTAAYRQRVDGRVRDSPLLLDLSRSENRSASALQPLGWSSINSSSGSWFAPPPSVRVSTTREGATDDAELDISAVGWAQFVDSVATSGIAAHRTVELLGAQKDASEALRNALSPASMALVRGAAEKLIAGLVAEEPPETLNVLQAHVDGRSVHKLPFAVYRTTLRARAKFHTGPRRKPWDTSGSAADLADAVSTRNNLELGMRVCLLWTELLAWRATVCAGREGAAAAPPFLGLSLHAATADRLRSTMAVAAVAAPGFDPDSHPLGPSIALAVLSMANPALGAAGSHACSVDPFMGPARGDGMGMYTQFKTASAVAFAPASQRVAQHIVAGLLGTWDALVAGGAFNSAEAATRTVRFVDATLAECLLDVCQWVCLGLARCVAPLRANRDKVVAGTMRADWRVESELQCAAGTCMDSAIFGPMKLMVDTAAYNQASVFHKLLRVHDSAARVAFVHNQLLRAVKLRPNTTLCRELAAQVQPSSDGDDTEALYFTQQTIGQAVQRAAQAPRAVLVAMEGQDMAFATRLVVRHAFLLQCLAWEATAGLGAGTDHGHDAPYVPLCYADIAGVFAQKCVDAVDFAGAGRREDGIAAGVPTQPLNDLASSAEVAIQQERVKQLGQIHADLSPGAARTAKGALRWPGKPNPGPMHGARCGSGSSQAWRVAAAECEQCEWFRRQRRCRCRCSVPRL